MPPNFHAHFQGLTHTNPAGGTCEKQKVNFRENKDATLLHIFDCSVSKCVNSFLVLLLKKVGQKSTHLEDFQIQWQWCHNEKLTLVQYLILSRAVNYL